MSDAPRRRRLLRMLGTALVDAGEVTKVMCKATEPRRRPANMGLLAAIIGGTLLP